MTKKQFDKLVTTYYQRKQELEAMKEQIATYMAETSSIDEVIQPMDDGKELAVTYCDGYIQSRMNTAQVKEDYKAMGKPVPMTEVTVSRKVDVKIRKVKK